jgi:tetratricopeptide (TPR) repeat protein
MNQMTCRPAPDEVPTADTAAGRPGARADRPRPQPLGPLLAVPAFAVVATLVAFYPALTNGYADLDDEINFLRNPHFRGLSWDQLQWAWGTAWLGVYQPLSWTLFSAEHTAFGLRPEGYHAVSLLLHAANAVLLYHLTLAILARCGAGFRAGDPVVRASAALVVGLYAVHPLRTEVVTWLSCQPYLPCAFFFMAATFTYLVAHDSGRSHPIALLVASFVMYWVALHFKAPAVALPAVLLILDVFPLRRLRGGLRGWLGRPSWRVWLEKVPFVMLAFRFALFAARVRWPIGGVHPLYENPLSRLAVAAYGACFYPLKTVAPVKLSAYYALPQAMSAADPVFAAPIAAVAAVTVAALAVWRSRPWLLTSWACYLAALAPMSGVVFMGWIIAADRYSYLPSLCGVPLATAGVCWLVRRGRFARAVVFTTGPALLVGLVLLSQARCRVWHDADRFWYDSLIHSTWTSSDLHINVGATKLERGEVDAAVFHIAEAARLKPDKVSFQIYLSQALGRAGRVDEAVAKMSETIKRWPDFAETYYHLGVILGRHGRTKDAISNLSQAVTLQPNYAEAHCELGSVLEHAGKFDAAISHYTKALRLRPNYAEARRGLEVAMKRKGEDVRSHPE